MEDLEHNLKTKEEMEVVHLSTLFWLLDKVVQSEMVDSGSRQDHAPIVLDIQD